MHKVLSQIFLIVMIWIQAIYPQIISLNGEWDFITDTAGEYSIESLQPNGWRKTIVPLSWQAQFEDLRDYQGVGWYRSNFKINDVQKDKLYLIKFEAVDYLSRLYINRDLVGENEGGYTPFDFDITKYLKSGDNEIILRVLDPVNEDTLHEGIGYYNIPHGKQTWYVQTSGIWRSVSLIIKPLQYLKRVHITPATDGKIYIEGIVNNPAEGMLPVDLKIYDPSGREILSNQETVHLKENTFTINAELSDVQLWSFDAPKLYRAEITLNEDTVIENFGIRSIEARDKKLYLNGKPFYMIGALDQDFYPETIYTTPSEEYLRDEMLKAKQLGLNTLRCHIKVPDPLYLKVADEVGLLVWCEVPNWDVFSPEAGKRGAETLDRMLERDWNHPSFVILSLINESWGIDLQKEEQRKWLLEEFDRVKEKAVGRLVVDNSACWGNFHIKTDLNDFHTYASIPENREEFNNSVKDIASRASWLFSESGDSQETGNEPLLLSEFGNWGLPKLPEKLPWWFSRQFLDIEVSLPFNVHKRFTDYKYDKIFGSYNHLAEESQKAQFNALKYEIEKIRMTPEIQGYIITEFTDINWECNGLLDMWRNFKIYSEDLPLIQQQDVLIPRPRKYNYYASQEAEIELFVSHYSETDLADAELHWKLNNDIKGLIKVDDLKNNDVTKIESLRITLPEVIKPEKIRIEFNLINKAGAVIARNFAELFVFGKSEVNQADIYEVSAAEISNTFITNTIDQNIIDNLNDGKFIICLIDSATILPENLLPYKILSRNEEWLDGNWATNMNWLRDYNPLFNGLSFGNSFGFEIAQTIPDRVISGIPAENYDDVLSGMFVGWLHKNSGYIVQMKKGKGRLILCTFPIAKNYSTDPFAVVFLKNLIQYIGSNDFNPVTEMKLN
jgi:hypothetical protein